MAKYDDELDAVAHALAHRGRRQIVAHLADRTASSTQLAHLLDIGLPALHKHLELLRSASMITSTKSGRTVTHALQPDGLDQMADWVLTRRSFWGNQFDALEHHLEDQ